MFFILSYDESPSGGRLRFLIKKIHKNSGKVDERKYVYEKVKDISFSRVLFTHIYPYSLVYMYLRLIPPII